MSLRANEIKFGSLSTYNYGVDGYDSTKLGLGSMIFQSSTNGSVSPPAIGIGRPIETGGTVPAYHIDTVAWSSTLDWVFLADQAAAAATRRVQLYTYDKSSSTFTWKGFITCSFPSAGTQGVYTVRGINVTYKTYSIGTAAVSGTAVTGTSSLWSTNAMCAGSRIAFGTIDPTTNPTWYEISAVGSDTSITLTGSAGTISNGSYVIEVLTATQVVTNATTATNGGIFVSKGLRFENFNGGGTAIAAAVSTDLVARTNYWLKDAATVTNTTAFGCDAQWVDWTHQYLYVIDTLANPILFKYNIRAALTLTSGADTTAFSLKSGAYGALTGTPSQNNNFCVVTASHGSGNGALCGYFTTASRVYRTVDVTTIISGSTSWAGDNCLEVPPGASVSFALTNTLNNIQYSSMLDMFVITTSGRSYITKYRSDGSQWDRIFLSDNKQTQQIASSADLTPMPSFSIGTPLLSTFSGGILYLVGTGLTNITNFLFAMPIGADWEYTSTSNQVVITPSFSTTDAISYVRAYISQLDLLGGTSGHNLGMPTEPVRISVRTSGVSDNSGTWSILPTSGDMSSLSASTAIQLKLEFRTIGHSCIPAQISAFGFTYNDLSTDTHYQPSVGQSSLSSKQFAWRFSTAFGTTVPKMKIQLYDAVSTSLLLTDDSVTQIGTWQQSTDGGSTWNTWTSADKGNETTYLRYTPASLGDNIKVRALLTQY